MTHVSSLDFDGVVWTYEAIKAEPLGPLYAPFFQEANLLVEKLEAERAKAPFAEADKLADQVQGIRMMVQAVRERRTGAIVEAAVLPYFHVPETLSVEELATYRYFREKLAASEREYFSKYPYLRP